MIVGTALRAMQAGESLWLDELHTSWAVSGSLGEVAERAMIGNQSPLYFWLAWFFARLPITPEVALRLPSLVAGSALPLAVYWLTGKLLVKSAAEKSFTPGLLAAWLTALDPLAIFHAQDARPYAILQLVAVLHIGALLTLLREANMRARLAWIISGALLVHLHYTAVLILAGELVAILICCTSPSADQVAPAAKDGGDTWLVCIMPRLIDIALLGLLLTPALVGMMNVAARRQQWATFITAEEPQRILTLFPCASFCVALGLFQRWKKLVDPTALWLISGWLLVPLITAWLLTAMSVAPLFFPRYLIAAWSASMIAAGMFWVVPRTATSRQMYVIAIVAWQLYSGGLWKNWLADGRLLHDRNEDWRLAMATLAPAFNGIIDPPVLVRSGFLEADDLDRRRDLLFREYCLAPVLGIYRIQPMPVFYPLTNNDPGQLQPDVKAALQRSSETWLLVRSSRDAVARAAVREKLLRDLQQSLGSDFKVKAAPPVEFGSLYLQHVQLKEPTPEF